MWRNHTNMNNVFHLINPVYSYPMDTYIFTVNVFTDVHNTKGTRAHTHRKLI